MTRAPSAMTGRRQDAVEPGRKAGVPADRRRCGAPLPVRKGEAAEHDEHAGHRHDVARPVEGRAIETRPADVGRRDPERDQRAPAAPVECGTGRSAGPTALTSRRKHAGPLTGAIIAALTARAGRPSAIEVSASTFSVSATVTALNGADCSDSVRSITVLERIGAQFGERLESPALPLHSSRSSPDFRQPRPGSRLVQGGLLRIGRGA
jgi:hypothetical protein